MQEYEPLAQTIDSAVDELQDTSVDTDTAVSKHGGNKDERMEIPHLGKYPDWPDIQRLYDIGTVMNNEAPLFIDSVQITQNCMKEHEYKTILQSLKEKHQEFCRHYACSYNQTTANTVLFTWRCRQWKIMS